VDDFVLNREFLPYMRVVFSGKIAKTGEPLVSNAILRHSNTYIEVG